MQSLQANHLAEVQMLSKDSRACDSNKFQSGHSQPRGAGKVLSFPGTILRPAGPVPLQLQKNERIKRQGLG